MTDNTAIFDEYGSSMNINDIPVECQADKCDKYVDRDAPQLRLFQEKWTFSIWLWLCPRHVGMAAMFSELLQLDEDGNRI